MALSPFWTLAALLVWGGWCADGGWPPFCIQKVTGSSMKASVCHTLFWCLVSFRSEKMGIRLGFDFPRSPKNSWFTGDSLLILAEVLPCLDNWIHTYIVAYFILDIFRDFRKMAWSCSPSNDQTNLFYSRTIRQVRGPVLVLYKVELHHCPDPRSSDSRESFHSAQSSFRSLTCFCHCFLD